MVMWVIDDLLTESREISTGFPALKEAVEQCGEDVTVLKYVPFTNDYDFDEVYENIGSYDNEEPIVVHGSIQFVKQVMRNKPHWCPGAYLKEHNLKFSTCSTYFGALMFNSDYQLMTFGEVIRKQPFREKFFIRPDKVTKPFAGRVVDFDDLADDPQNLWKYNNIDFEEMCVIAPAKKKHLIGEYRHYIVNHRVVAESQYQRDGKLDIRIDVQPECNKLARRIAEEDWQPDYCYTVDTVWDGINASIMEFNSFSCSGIYACDTSAIVRAVSEMATKEFRGELDDC